MSLVCSLLETEDPAARDGMLRCEFLSLCSNVSTLVYHRRRHLPKECSTMLTIYRLHRKRCKQRANGRKYRHCQCPIWVDGTLGGKEVRESLKTPRLAAGARDDPRVGSRGPAHTPAR